MMSKRIVFALMTAMLLALPAAAQVRLGLRGGITVGELRFSREIIDSDNRAGFTGGLLVDVGIPVTGLGIEVSAMYTHRNNRLTDGQRTFKRHYIDIPVYARYRMGIAGIGHVFAPYIFTGPSFSILFDDSAPGNYDNNKTYLSWDVGGGAELFNHWRLSATYGIGISKAMEYIDREYTGDKVSGKDRYWTLSVAYLF